MPANTTSNDSARQGPDSGWIDPTRATTVAAWVLAAAAIFGVAVIGYYRWKFGSGVLVNHEKWGQFGDYVGGLLNPVLQFISGVLLALTLSVQAWQIRQGKRDAAAAAEVMRLTMQAQERAAVALDHAGTVSMMEFKAQAFEFQFRQALEGLADARAGLEIPSGDAHRPNRGPAVFQAVADRLSSAWRHFGDSVHQDGARLSLRGRIDSEFDNHQEETFSAYVRSLEHAIHIVREADSAVVNVEVAYGRLFATMRNKELVVVAALALRRRSGYLGMAILDMGLPTVPRDALPAAAGLEALWEEPLFRRSLVLP